MERITLISKIFSITGEKNFIFLLKSDNIFISLITENEEIIFFNDMIIKSYILDNNF